MEERRMMLMVVVAALLASVLGSCMLATGGPNTDYGRSRIATRRGFVEESDEPSSRGILQRVSPQDTNIDGRFSISPDGQFIVFSGTQKSAGSRRSAASHLWRIPASGGSPVKLTSGGSSDCAYPCFGPKGHFIYYSSRGSIWRISADGSGGRTKLPGSGLNRDFAPNVNGDGRIAFTGIQRRAGGLTRHNEYFLWIMDGDGRNLTQLRSGYLPFWSPDGESIVFGHKGDIWTVRADGTELTQLTSSADVFEGVASFSADGNEIIYASNEGKDGKPMRYDYNIWTINLSDGTRTQMTELSSWDSWPLLTEDAMIFLSGRASSSARERFQRIWRIRLRQPLNDEQR